VVVTVTAAAAAAEFLRGFAIVRVRRDGGVGWPTMVAGAF
jgi:hypothetical protein